MEYLDAIINSISYPIFVKDIHHRLVYVNDAECELAGRGREELIGRTDYDFFPGEQVDIFWKKDDEVLETGRENVNEEEITDSKGQKRIIVTKKNLYVDKAGNRFIVGIIRDISERKQAEKYLRERHLELENRVRERTAELMESEERYRSLFENAHDMIVSVLPDGRFIYVNPSWMRITGYGREDILNLTIYDVFHPQLKYVCEELFRKVMSGGSVENLETVFISREGREINVEGNINARIVGGRAVAFYGIFRDISERKKVDEILKREYAFRESIIRNAAEGLSVFYNTEEYPYIKFTVWNDRMTEITGYTMEEINRLGWYQTMHPYPGLQSKMKNRIERTSQGDDLFKEEWEIARADGEKRILSITTSVLDTGDGLSQVMALMQDITEHKNLESQLIQAQKMEAVGQLAGGIAHDFNNLLTAIIGYGNLLKSEVGHEMQSSSYITQILNAAERAAALTKDLLTFSRKHIVTPRPVNLNKIIKDSETLLLRIIGGAVKLSVSLHNEDFFIMADTSQIERVLMNLAANARDAMPNGGNLLVSTGFAFLDNEFIKTYGYGKQGRYATVSFEDTGHGMDERTRSRIFEPFFSTKEVGKGTGLGLAMVYGIMKQHYGYVNVHSEPGKGTFFKMYFPLIEAGFEEKSVGDTAQLSGGA
jgi:two-component system, cell cycle sensor histidine kinase and response regulator CckA